MTKKRITPADIGAFFDERHRPRVVELITNHLKGNDHIEFSVNQGQPPMRLSLETLHRRLVALKPKEATYVGYEILTAALKGQQVQWGQARLGGLVSAGPTNYGGSPSRSYGPHH